MAMQQVEIRTDIPSVPSWPNQGTSWLLLLGVMPRALGALVAAGPGPCPANGKERAGRLNRGQEIEDETGEHIPLSQWKRVRGPGDHGQLAFRQGLVQRDRMWQCDQIIVADDDEHRPGNSRDVGRRERRLRTEHSETLADGHFQVLGTVR